MPAVSKNIMALKFYAAYNSRLMSPSRLSARSELLLSRGVHRTPAPPSDGGAYGLSVEDSSPTEPPVRSLNDGAMPLIEIICSEYSFHHMQ